MTTKKCPRCGESNAAYAWICESCGWEFDVEVPVRAPRPEAPRINYKGEKTSWFRNSTPFFLFMGFCLLGVNWIAVIWGCLFYLRPHPLNFGDKMIAGVAVVLALYYFWVGYGVYTRRGHIWNTAVVCAGFALLSPPAGTVISLVILFDLLISKANFTE